MAIGALDAVSLAAAVIQMVEFSCKLVFKDNELYQSTDGTLVENRELASVAQNLRRLGKRIENPSSWVMGHMCSPVHGQSSHCYSTS